MAAKERIGDRLKSARELAGHSIEDLARMADVSESTIRAIETDPTRSPPASSVFALSDALSVDARWLATGAGAGPVAPEQPSDAEFVTLVLEFESSADAAAKMQQIALYSSLGGGRVVALEAGKDIREICERHATKAIEDVRYLIQTFLTMKPEVQQAYMSEVRAIAKAHPRREKSSRSLDTAKDGLIK